MVIKQKLDGSLACVTKYTALCFFFFFKTLHTGAVRNSNEWSMFYLQDGNAVPYKRYTTLL